MTASLRLDHMLRQAVAEGVAPAIAFAVGEGDAPPSAWYAGHHTPDSALPTSSATRFDLASLTKPLTTTLWCLRLVEQGALQLDDPIGRHVEVEDAQLASTPVWRLLNHTSGLPAYRPYYQGLGPNVARSGRHADARRALRRMLRATPLEETPGHVERYSDLGYLLLELVCEAADAPLDAVWPTLPHHGPDAIHFVPLPTGIDPTPYAATEDCPWRGRLLRGEVHDDNCWTIGGIGGHAGGFATLPQVYALAADFLALARGRDRDLGVSPELLQRSVDRRWMHPQGTRVLGWDTPTPGASTSGRHFGRRSIGHLGFTGTSVWIDLEAEVVMVLLTNRVCPNRDNPRVRDFRPRIHDAAWAWLRGEG